MLLYARYILDIHINNIFYVYTGIKIFLLSMTQSDSFMSFLTPHKIANKQYDIPLIHVYIISNHYILHQAGLTVWAEPNTKQMVVVLN